MPRRRIAMFVALALVVASCSIGSTSPPTGAAIDDPATLAALGVAEPGPVVWRRSLGPVDLVGTTTRAVPGEVELVAVAFAEMPAAVLDAIPLRTIVRTSGLDGADLHPATTAFARGPDIYVIDRTFTEPRAGATRFGMTRILLHEMAHVAQFAALDPEYVDMILDGRITETDTSNGSLLVADFAEAAGWRNESGTRFQPGWNLPPGRAGTTEYGRTSPDEDMAESLAMVVIGRADLISADRVRWIENWLEIGADTLSVGKPWVPAGSVEAFFDQPVYDEAEVAAQRTAHVDPAYFLLPADSLPAERLASTVASELRRRGLVGQLTLVADNRLPRYSGIFPRADGVRFWVELWDFRESTAFTSPPPGPILSYVALW